MAARSTSPAPISSAPTRRLRREAAGPDAKQASGSRSNWHRHAPGASGVAAPVMPRAHLVPKPVSWSRHPRGSRAEHVIRARPETGGHLPCNSCFHLWSRRLPPDVAGLAPVHACGRLPSILARCAFPWGSSPGGAADFPRPSAASRRSFCRDVPARSTARRRAGPGSWIECRPASLFARCLDRSPSELPWSRPCAGRGRLAAGGRYVPDEAQARADRTGDPAASPLRAPSDAGHRAGRRPGPGASDAGDREA
jgi:hypothetical protein